MLGSRPTSWATMSLGDLASAAMDGQSHTLLFPKPVGNDPSPRNRGAVPTAYRQRAGRRAGGLRRQQCDPRKIYLLQLGRGDISAHECADCIPFGSLTSTTRPRDTGGGLRLEGADTAKVHRANKWSDADEGCPGAQMLEISSKQTDRQTHIHTRARARTHTSWSPCHPAGVILITEDSHLKTNLRAKTKNSSSQ